MQPPATMSIPGWQARCHFPPQHSILRAAVPISWPFSQSQRKTGSAEEHKFALSERSEFSKFMRCGSLPSPDFDDFPRRRVGQRWAPPPGRSASSFRALQRTVRIPARRRLGRKVTSPPSGAERVRFAVRKRALGHGPQCNSQLRCRFPGGRPGVTFRRATPFAPFSGRRESQPAGDAAAKLLLLLREPEGCGFFPLDRNCLFGL